MYEHACRNGQLYNVQAIIDSMFTVSNYGTIKCEQPEKSFQRNQVKIMVV